jgi:hypothetical protein
MTNLECADISVATTPRAICHRCSVGLATCRATNDTAKLMSGLVHLATHCRDPTISWKGVSGTGGEPLGPDRRLSSIQW